MSKKRRFGISEALTRGLSETIHVVENNAGLYRNVVLPLSRIELDPENPRKLAINLQDVRQGIAATDPLYQMKHDELDRLKELAHTIKSSGVINPIVVYKLGETYRVVAGERRCLASILVGKQEIDARIFNEKPKAFDLKLIQWIENTAREDLTLAERLGNVKEIIREYKHQFPDADVNATLLKTITGLSLSQTTYYMAALNAPKDVSEAIKDGLIRNLDKAALIANVDSRELRQQMIEACVNAATLKELRQLINQQKVMNRSKVSIEVKSRGRVANKINMGTTLKTDVVKAIIDSLLGQKKFSKYTDVFAAVNWSDFRDSTKAFRKMVEILEMEMAV